MQLISCHFLIFFCPFLWRRGQFEGVSVDLLCTTLNVGAPALRYSHQTGQYFFPCLHALISIFFSFVSKLVCLLLPCLGLLWPTYLPLEKFTLQSTTTISALQRDLRIVSAIPSRIVEWIKLSSRAGCGLIFFFKKNYSRQVSHVTIYEL